MRKKLVMLGAGSAVFTQGLILDLIQKQPGGHAWELALVDVDEDTLRGITRLAQKMVNEAEADILISSSPERRDVLPGADYVVSTIGVGGRRAWEQDVFIPRKYGIHQPVGDTAMPGGISRAMRMTPVTLAFVRDCARLCPSARIFNYANPMAVMMRAVRKELDAPVVGLCHGTINDERRFADTLGVPRGEVTSLAAGINHCTFLYELRHLGRDMLPELRRRVLGSPDHPLARHDPFAWSFFDRYNAYPSPGDRHISEFFTELFPGGAYYGKRLGHDAFSFEQTIAGGDRVHAEAMALAASDAPLGPGFFARRGGEHEQLIDILDSIERDLRRIFYMNVPNRGATPNLPDWAVLEIPTVASASGCMPVQTRGFPDVLAAMTTRQLSVVELTVDAAVKADRGLMLEAILAGGYISDRAQASKMTDELLFAQREHLPEFFR